MRKQNNTQTPSPEEVALQERSTPTDKILAISQYTDKSVRTTHNGHVHWIPSHTVLVTFLFYSDTNRLVNVETKNSRLCELRIDYLIEDG